MLDTQNEDVGVLFKKGGVESFNDTWTSYFEEIESEYFEVNENKLNDKKLTADEADKLFEKFNNMAAGAKIKYLRSLSKSWYASDINGHLC